MHVNLRYFPWAIFHTCCSICCLMLIGGQQCVCYVNRLTLCFHLLLEIATYLCGNRESTRTSGITKVLTRYFIWKGFDLIIIEERG